MRRLPRLKPLAKGLASFVVPRLGTVHGYANPLGTRSAESCYSIFLRHITALHGLGVQQVPHTVAELGPGSSLGTGLAALIAGAETYYALDIIDFSDRQTNLAIFDALADMFRERRPIPSRGVHSLRFPDLDSYAYPDFLTRIAPGAFERRVAAIRHDIAAGTGIFIRIAAPWTELSRIAHGSVDWVFSQSVMEHIDDLDGVYTTLARWVKPSGWTSHLIDFSSHGMTREWNGHWMLADPVWSALRGRRPYLINRQPYTDHRTLSDQHGFDSIHERRSKRFDGFIPSQFAPRFRSVSDEDARSHMVFVISQRRTRQGG